MNQQDVPDLKYLFQPRTVAIVGASREEFKSGGMFFNNLVKAPEVIKILDF